MIEGGASAPSPRPHLSRPYAVDHSSPTRAFWENLAGKTLKTGKKEKQYAMRYHLFNSKYAERAKENGKKHISLTPSVMPL
jgi:hypothetical protein